MLKKIFDTRNQYYYLCSPQLVFIIVLIYTIKSLKKLESYKLPIFIVTFAFKYLFPLAIFIGIIPQILSNYLGWTDFLKSTPFIYYYNFIMIFFGIHLIKLQEKEGL